MMNYDYHQIYILDKYIYIIIPSFRFFLRFSYFIKFNIFLFTFSLFFTYYNLTSSDIIYPGKHYLHFDTIAQSGIHQTEYARYDYMSPIMTFNEDSKEQEITSKVSFQILIFLK